MRGLSWVCCEMSAVRGVVCVGLLATVSYKRGVGRGWCVVHSLLCDV